MQACLHPEPQRRLTCQQLLQLPYFREAARCFQLKLACGQVSRVPELMTGEHHSAQHTAWPTGMCRPAASATQVLEVGCCSHSCIRAHARQVHALQEAQQRTSEQSAADHKLRRLKRKQQEMDRASSGCSSRYGNSATALCNDRCALMPIPVSLYVVLPPIVQG